MSERQYHGLEDPTSLDILGDFYQAGAYFYTVATRFFIEDIDYEKIDIPIYQLYVREQYLDALNNDLPASGLEYVNGDFVFNGTHYDIDLRYRGDTFYHWYFAKKSWRIKLDDHKFLNGSNKFNVINPKSDSHIDEILVAKMADDAGILSPRIFPVALFLNNQYVGVYYYSDQIDELFIRNNQKMPGDIFYGELYGDTTRNGTLFQNKSNWDIEATADGNESRAYKNIDALIQAVSSNDLDFYNFFVQHLGDEYLRYYALTLLIDEDRVDDYHNHKLYFNPTNGMFEPIVWDLMPFAGIGVPLNNEQSNALFSKINKNPLLVERRNIFLKQFIDDTPEEELFSFIDECATSIEYELLHDLYKDSYAAPWLLTDEMWYASQKKLKDAITNRYAFIRQELDNASVTLYVMNDRFIFDISGQSAVQIKGGDILYPGKNHALRYIYSVEQTEDETVREANFTFSSLTLSNTITGKPITPEIVFLDSLENLPLIEADSIHPWALPIHEKQTITLEGEITLRENLVIKKGDSLVIKPGTTIKLDSGVSIVSYGKVTAIGSAEQPISFVPFEEDKPWGGFAIQGHGANGSVFQYCTLDGGSGVVYDLAVYTGMLSAHNTDITIDHCTFKNNQIKDDAVNPKLSHAIITNSTFIDIFSDAIDFDIITDGIIEQNGFMNIGGDAIDLMTSTPVVRRNLIINAQDKGISVGEMSSPIITDNIIKESTTGIAIKDRSNPLIINNTLENNDVGIAAYEKNWQYGGGGFGTVSGTNICKNTQAFLIQNSSFVKIERDGIYFECTEQQCALQC